MKSYAGYYKDSIREISSSGAIFCALAKYILKEKGVVYAVCMTTDKYSAHFERATDFNVVKKMLGSKYMQATMGDSYKQVRKDLDNGFQVLFCGTICQINGLKLFLRRDYENLVCIDIICHGVPSHKLWKKYLMYREETIGKCNNLNFRSKEQGWYNSGIKENNIFTPQCENDYMNLFLKDLCLRPSCYKCICKKTKLSDITLGDLWGVNEVAPELNDDKGISTIILRTTKAEKIFDSIKDELVFKEITYKEATLDNPAEYESSKKPSIRKNFYKDLEKKTFKTFLKKYLEQTLFWKYLRKIQRKIFD